MKDPKWKGFLEYQELQTESATNPFLSLLNGLGIFGSGVLGSLYALSQEEKKTSDETIESVSFLYYKPVTNICISIQGGSYLD